MGTRRSARRESAPIELRVEALDREGRGVARHEARRWRIDGALAGELVRARELRRSRGDVDAVADEVLQVAPERVAPFCPHFGTCGGCRLQHLSSAAQVAHKQAGILDALARAGVVPETVVDPLRGPTRGYRRRARLGAKWVEKKGRVLVGFRERDKRFVADLSECGILDGDAGRLIDPLARLLERSALRAAVPQIEVAVGDDATALVLRVLEDPDPDALAALAAFERTHAVTVCLQRGGLSTVCDLQGRSVVLSYRLPAHDVTIELAPTDFVQVHGVLNRAMVDRALDWLDVGPGDHVLDLFCGLGNFSLPLARRVATVTCIEGDAALVDRARANAVRNGIANAEFLAADLEREPLALPSGPFGRVLLDPPRSGAAAVAARLAHRRVPTVVYVSCGPDAFVADARTLVAAGYRLTRFGVMDLFPHTAHFETIARFEG